MGRREQAKGNRESNQMEIGCVCQRICCTHLLYFSFGVSPDTNPTSTAAVPVPVPGKPSRTTLLKLVKSCLPCPLARTHCVRASSTLSSRCLRSSSLHLHLATFATACASCFALVASSSSSGGEKTWRWLTSLCRRFLMQKSFINAFPSELL